MRLREFWAVWLGLYIECPDIDGSLQDSVTLQSISNGDPAVLH